MQLTVGMSLLVYIRWLKYVTNFIIFFYFLEAKGIRVFQILSENYMYEKSADRHLSIHPR